MEQKNFGSGDNIGRDKNLIFNIGKWLIPILIAAVLFFTYILNSNFQKGVNVVVKQNNGKVDIKGKWNKNLADNIVLSLLNENMDVFPDSMCTSKKNVKHSVINYFYTENSGIPRMVGASYSHDTTWQSHVSYASLSFFEFDKVEEGWVIGNKFLFGIEANAWSDYKNENADLYKDENDDAKENEDDSENGDLSIYNIGVDKYGVVIRDLYSSTGETHGTAKIYCNIAGVMKEVFEYEYLFDLSGIYIDDRTLVKSQLEPIKDGSSFYDIIVHKTGTNNWKKISNKKKYSFNGIYYYEDKTIK